MLFGGLHKNSLIDFPGKISCVLFVMGCNFDCPYCHNPKLAKGCIDDQAAFDADSAYDFLENRKGFLEGVVISGGEPTLQEELIAICQRIKQIGYPIKLDTNGSRPQVLKRLIEAELVDYVAMDIKTDPFRYAPLIKKNFNPDTLLSSIRILMESKVDYEFKTTCIKPLVDADVIETISRLIKGSPLYALQQFHNTDVLHPEFFQENDCRYDSQELKRLKSIAAPWVDRCIVR